MNLIEAANMEAEANQPTRGANPQEPNMPAGGPAGFGMPPMMMAPKLGLKQIAYFWKFTVGHRTAAVTTIVLLLVVAALQMAPAFAPVALARLGAAGQPGGPGRLAAYGFLAVLLAGSLLAIAGQFVGGYLSARIAESVGRRIKVALFRKVGALPAGQTNEHSIGAMAFRVGGDVQNIRDFFTPGLTQCAGDAFVLIIAFAAMSVFAWPYALLCLLAAIVIAFTTQRGNTRVNHWAGESQHASERAMTQYIEGIAGYRDLVASDRFGRAADEYDRRLQRQERAVLSTYLWGSIASLAPQLVFTGLYFGYYFLSAGLNGAGAQQLAMAVTFVSVLGFIRGPVMQLSQFSSRAAAAAPAFAKVQEILESPEVTAAANPAASVRDGSIEFDRVTFGYAPEMPPVLQDLSFRIKPGSFTAIVGQSGSGKTTLFHLLLRLLDPTSGQIQLGGVPLPQIAIPQLRQYLGFIPQAPFIFDSTIRDNLTLGTAATDGKTSTTAEDESRLREAIRLAQLDELVNRRAAMGGLDAPVGPGGASLSGGERQRIALGRLFLRDPQVIVCDEYTANIDNATARLIRESLATKFAGHTRVVVTHQLYTIRGADQILVLDKGRIVDRGTHEELLARAGLYRDMWELQRID